MIIDILSIILFFFFLKTIIRRFYTNPLGNLLNPLFLLCIFSFLYLVLPNYYINYTLLVNQRDVSEKAIFICKMFGFWYFSVFYFFYLKSGTQYLCLSSSPNKYSEKIAFAIWIFISFLLLVIIFLYFNQIYSLKANRGLALSIYESTINTKFKLRILMYVHLCCIFILFWKSKSLLYLLPCFLYLIIDYAHGGRTMSFMVLIFSYIIIVIKTGKHYIIPCFTIIVLLSLSAILQRSTFANIRWTFYMAGAEFSLTHLTSLFLLDDPSLFTQSGLNYFIVSISRILPGGIVDRYIEFGEWYGNGLSDSIGFGYGLAGNIMTESIIYGGVIGCFLSPVFIGFFLYILVRKKIIKSLWGFFYIFMLVISMQNICRSFFYGFILYPLQIIIFPLLWTGIENKKNVFAIRQSFQKKKKIKLYHK